MYEVGVSSAPDAIFIVYPNYLIRAVFCVICYKQGHAKNQDGYGECSDKPDRDNILVKRQNKPKQDDHDNDLYRFRLQRRYQCATCGGAVVARDNCRKSSSGDNADYAPQ